MCLFNGNVEPRRKEKKSKKQSSEEKNGKITK